MVALFVAVLPTEANAVSVLLRVELDVPGLLARDLV